MCSDKNTYKTKIISIYRQLCGVCELVIIDLQALDFSELCPSRGVGMAMFRQVMLGRLAFVLEKQTNNIVVSETG